MEAISIADRVRQVISDHTGLKVTNESALYDDLNCDSLDRIEIIMAIEDEYGIEIDDSTFNRLDTVASVIRVIELECAKQGVSKR